jgi:hypothetical protein
MPDEMNGICLLSNYLNKQYGADHKVIVYEAAQYPHFKPRIEECELMHLSNAHITQISTLYVPPACAAVGDEIMIKQLGINIADLQ